MAQLQIVLYDIQDGPTPNLPSHHSKNGCILLSLESAFDLLFRQESVNACEAAKSLVRDQVPLNAAHFNVRLHMLSLGPEETSLAIELTNLAEFVSLTVQLLLASSADAFRLSFLPHTDLTSFATSGDYWAVFQTLKRTCLSAGRSPRVLILPAALAGVPELNQPQSNSSTSSVPPVMDTPLTVSGNDLANFFASLEPVHEHVHATTSDHYHHQHYNMSSPLNMNPISQSGGHQLLGAVSGASGHHFPDPTASYLGTVPIPTIEYVYQDDLFDSQPSETVELNPSAPVAIKRERSAAYTEQVKLRHDHFSDPKFQSLHSYAPQPYSRPPPPGATTMPSSSTPTTTASSSSLHVGTAQSKSVVSDISQITTAWNEGELFIPLYIATAYIIGGGSTPTDARRWLNRAPPRFQPTADDSLPAKVAGALPRVRYVKWTFIERLIHSEGLESSVPKERLQHLTDKLARFERLKDHVFSQVSHPGTSQYSPTQLFSTLFP